MALAGAALASVGGFRQLARMPILAVARAEDWRSAAGRTHLLQATCGLGFWVLALGALAFGTSLTAGFVVIGGLLLGAALLLPTVLGVMIGLLGRLVRGPLAEWVVADSRQQMGATVLALMALLLALSVNIGVGTMVGSFRDTFHGWLDQRLAAEVYVFAESNEAAAAVQGALSDDVDALLPIGRVELRHGDRPVELYGQIDHATYREAWPLLAALPDAWAQVIAGQGALINEQMARRLDLGPGDALTLPARDGPRAFQVAGIYTDYGNPNHQVIIALDRLRSDWAGVDLRRFGIRTDPAGVQDLMARLAGDHGLAADRVTDQARLKAFSKQVFEATFRVTVALNALTFAVAGVAILTSLLTLSAARLPQVAPVWALGVPRGRIALLEVLRAGLLALLTALVAIPLGAGAGLGAGRGHQCPRLRLAAAGRADAGAMGAPDRAGGGGGDAGGRLARAEPLPSGAGNIAEDLCQCALNDCSQVCGLSPFLPHPACRSAHRCWRRAMPGSGPPRMAMRRWSRGMFCSSRGTMGRTRIIASSGGTSQPPCRMRRACPWARNGPCFAWRPGRRRPARCGLTGSSGWPMRR